MFGIGKKNKNIPEVNAPEIPEFNFPEGSKAKIVVILEKESLWSKAGGKAGTLGLFMADRIMMQMDDQKPEKLVRQKPDVPFEFEVKPGPHMIQFSDPNAKAKNAFSPASIMGFMAGAAGGGLGGAFAGYELGKRTDIKDGVVQAVLYPEDVLTVSVKCTQKGDVKIKLIE